MAESKRNTWIAILVVGALILALFVWGGAIYLWIINKPMSYGITNVNFVETRAHPRVIEVTVENNKSVTMEIVTVFVNETEVGKTDPTRAPYVYPKIPVDVSPRSRVVLYIQDFGWEWSSLETKYVYEIRVITGDGTVFNESKETPLPPF